MSDKLQYLFFKFRKGISKIKKTLTIYFLLYIVLVCFGATRIQINALSGSGSGKRNPSGSGSRARIEVNPDRPNAVDPDPDPKRCFEK